MMTPAGPRPLNPKALLINRTIIDGRVLLYILEEVWGYVGASCGGTYRKSQLEDEWKKNSVQLLV